MSPTTPKRIRSAALLASIAFLGACSPHRSSGITQSENHLMLNELGLGSPAGSLDGFEISITRPNLIAGDWLAVQCASAGGYFDNYIDSDQWAPVYANVEATDE